MILAVLFVGIMLPLSCRAFAQGGPIAGSENLSRNPDMQVATLPVLEAEASDSSGKSDTDVESGNSAAGIPVLGNASPFGEKKRAYHDARAANGVESPSLPTNRTDKSRRGEATWLQDTPKETRQALSWETGTGKSYLIPALEIPAFLFLLNGYDRLAYSNDTEGGVKVYDTNLNTFSDHVFHGAWGVDKDSFAMNQFAHPYQGSMYQGFARSAGLNYWESLLYTNVGSFLWETGGETTNPSINDQFASGIGGSFFGEALFRMANLVLEEGGSDPGFWRELAAAMISPPTGINRLAFGDRFTPVFPSHHPATFWRLQFGANLNTDTHDKGTSSNIVQSEVTADFSMSYGLPGKPGYSYTRPFDYFHFEFTSLGNADNPFDNVMVRGLLLGKDYEVGNSFRGIWGL